MYTLGIMCVMHFLGSTMLTLYADAALQIKQFTQP